MPLALFSVGLNGTAEHTTSRDWNFTVKKKMKEKKCETFLISKFLLLLDLRGLVLLNGSKMSCKGAKAIHLNQNLPALHTRVKTNIPCRPDITNRCDLIGKISHNCKITFFTLHRISNRKLELPSNETPFHCSRSGWVLYKMMKNAFIFARKGKNYR